MLASVRRWTLRETLHFARCLVVIHHGVHGFDPRRIDITVQHHPFVQVGRLVTIDLLIPKKRPQRTKQKTNNRDARDSKICRKVSANKRSWESHGITKTHETRKFLNVGACPADIPTETSENNIKQRLGKRAEPNLQKQRRGPLLPLRTGTKKPSGEQWGLRPHSSRRVGDTGLARAQMDSCEPNEKNPHHRDIQTLSSCGHGCSGQSHSLGSQNAKHVQPTQDGS